MLPVVSEMIVGPMIAPVCINPTTDACESSYDKIKIVFVDDVVIEHLERERCNVRRVGIRRSAGARISCVFIDFHRVYSVRIVDAKAEITAVHMCTPVLSGTP